MSISATYVDTGTSDYLTDHHNRPGEMMISIPCCGQSVSVAMEEAWDQVNDEPLAYSGLTRGDVRNALRGVLETVDLRPFDPVTGKRTEHMDDDEYSYVWILLKFDVLRVRLRLTLDVDYSTNDATVESLVAALKFVASSAEANGQLTMDTAAEVCEWRSKVETIDDWP